MLRSSSKIKMFGALVSLASLPVLCAVSASATEVTRNTNFRVNVSDALSVSVTTPDQWAVGDINQFLRNRIYVSATTNAAAGLTATMTTKTTNTSLINSRKNSFTIPTLSGDEKVASFPVNKWGYSLEDAVAAPDDDTFYKALVPVDTQTPINVFEAEYTSTAAPGTYNANVFFGAKADSTIASGTYANTVVINVVTGVINNDPGNPDPNPDYNPNPPVNPSGDTTPDTPTYNPTNNQTTYTTVTHNNDDTTTTTTEVSEGDTTASYADPHGVKRKNSSSTSTNIVAGNPVATGIAVASAVAGTTGFIFFLIGKRRKDEEEEEEGAGEQQPPIQQ